MICGMKFLDRTAEMAWLKRLAANLRQKTVPAHFPSVSTYVLFLSAVTPKVPCVVQGVQVVTAKDVCSGS